MTRDNKYMDILCFLLLVALMLLFPDVMSAATAETAQNNMGNNFLDLGYLSAAIAVGMACIASAYAVARIGSAGLGAVSEKPELTGRVLIFLGLAEGIAIYGLIIAIMILNKL
jgi:V/A-type H+-transporting ATPase subunit K